MQLNGGTRRTFSIELTLSVLYRPFGQHWPCFKSKYFLVRQSVIVTILWAGRLKNRG